MTKTKHPNKGHSPSNGQRPMYQSVRYSETPLYLKRCYGIGIGNDIIIHNNLKHAQQRGHYK